jgi:hypothetical protein
VFFDVERDLHVRRTATHRPDEPQRDERRENRKQRDAQSGDRRRTELEVLQAPGREHQRQQTAAEHHDGASQQQAGAPSLANLPDDVDEFLTFHAAAH